MAARVTESFTKDVDPTPDLHLDVLEFIKLLIARIDEYTHAARRSVNFGLAAAAIFVLLQTDLAPRFSAGPMEILSNSTLATFLTSAVAYCYLSAMASVTYLERLTSAYAAAFTLWNKDAEDNDLELLILPLNPIYFSAAGRSPRTENRLPFDRRYEWVGGALIAPVLLLPPIFGVYAFISLFASFGANNVAVWINLALYTLFTISAYWLAFAISNEE